MKNDIIIDLYTICYNEMKIIPFVVDYWKKLNLRHIYIYDSNSNDGCIEYIKQNLNNVTILQQEVNDMDELYFQKLKNTCWKNSDADFVIMCDIDECIIPDDDFFNILNYMKEHNMTYTYTWFLQTISEKFPVYDNTKLLHEYENIKIIPQNKNDKCLIISPKNINNMNYCPGAHTCNPTGNVKLYDKWQINPIKTIHIQDLSYEYTINKFNERKARQAPINKQYGFDYHYYFSKEKIINDFNNNLKKSIKYSQL